MQLLDDGHGPTAVAQRLMVSRTTVYRYKRAAEEQGRGVPEPKPMGGWRHGKVDRGQLVAVAELALENPKDTLAELRDRAFDEGIFPQGHTVSLSSVSRALKKAGIKQQRAAFVDKRIESDPLIALERRDFKAAQRRDRVLRDPRNLLFMDESNFRLNEQQARGWGVAGQPARIYKPKGQSPTYNVMATIGSGGILHYVILKPERLERALATRYEANELKRPGEGVDVGLSSCEIKRHATAAELKDVLREFGVKRSNKNGQPLGLRELREAVLQLKRTGRVGLLRASRGRRFEGGPKMPHRATADDVADYLRDELARVPGVQGRTIIWDNASSHGAQGTKADKKVSVFERLSSEWGFGGVVYLPPRSPDLNPVEWLFAYTKRLVRKWAPDEGYSEDGLVDAIHRAFGRVTPDMIEHWITGCGYGPQPRRPDRGGPEQNCQTAERDLKRPGRMTCADPRGTVRKEKPAGRSTWRQVSKDPDDDEDLKDVAATRRRQRPRDDDEYDGPRRWPGYGRRPAGLVEQVPESLRAAGELEDDVYHVERLVDRRTRRGRVEYLVRWRGYGPEDDSWERRDHLMAGAERMVRDYERRRRR